jgi:probable rRNA maturation factor
MQIQISVKQKQIAIDRRRLRKAAKSILNALGYTEAELSITIVDDPTIAGLNREYRGIDAPTDVLAFAMHDGEFADICPEVLGDVVISAATGQLMAEQHACPLNAVLDLLLVHAILHLHGFDHQRSAADAGTMDAKTLSLLEQLGHTPEAFNWYRSAK